MKRGREIVLKIAIAAYGSFVPGSLSATEIYWVGDASNDWFDELNWSPEVIPGAEDIAKIGVDHAGTVVATEPRDGRLARLFVGDSVIGDLTISGNGRISTDEAIIGNREGVSGRILVDGHDAVFSVGSWHVVTIGRTGNGELILNDGARSFGMGVVIGKEPDSTGKFLVKGKGSEASFGGVAGVSAMRVGDYGHGTLEVLDGGSLQLAGSSQITLGRFSDGEGELLLRGSDSAISTNILHAGIGGKGSVTVSDHATLRLWAGQVGLTGIALGHEPGASGVLTIGEGEAPGLIDASSVQGRQGDATLNFNHNAPAHRFDNSEGNAVITTGSTRVNHIGPGTTILGGENTYTGDTTISDGTLRVDGSAANSVFTVESGGTLGGSGTVGSVRLQSGSFLSPGESAGTLTLDGDLHWEAGGTFLFDLGADALSSDFLDIGGSFFKEDEGEWAFEFADNGWVEGQTYDLIDFWETDFDANDFSILNAGPFDGELAFDDDTLQFTLHQIPEPGTYALLFGLAVAGLLVFRQRRSRE